MMLKEDKLLVSLCELLLFLLCSSLPSSCASPLIPFSAGRFGEGKNYEGSSDLVDLGYHMGPVLASPISLYIIWYGHWNSTHQATITDFIHSLSSSSSSSYPSVSDWWHTVQLYADQTGSNVTGDIVLSGQFFDFRYSHGAYLSRLDVQSIIRNAINSHPGGLPLNPHGGLYLVLTSRDVRVQDFCRAVCGFHYFTFPNIVGATLPYAWVGHSGVQCPGMCAYPFAWPKDYYGKPPPSTSAGANNLMRPPSGNPGVDGMVSVIAHELAEVSTNPLVNAWYAGHDPTAPTEIADLCLGIYGTGGGGGYVGVVTKDSWGWVWDPVRKRCFGPNALD